MFELWDVQDVGCLECRMLGISDIQDVGYLKCGMFGMCNVWMWGVGCTIFAGTLDVDL